MKKLSLLIFAVFICSATASEYSNEEETTTDVAETTENAKKHPFGHPLNLMSFTADHNITIDYEMLKEIFLHPEVENRKAVTISIIGAFRKGKSFIMDYFLRYLYANFQSIHSKNLKSGASSWMGGPTEPLTGFSWKSGTSRHTTGIVFWSDVFLYDAVNGEKYAIFLIDTQGLFDTKTPMEQNTKVFGLGTLISSLQIFNLNDVIQEDQLQYLQLATDYAKFALAENKAKGMKRVKPFQNLLFLMRDWKNKEEFDYGLDEGHRYLMEVLEVHDNQKPVLQDVRLHIQASFEKVYCFLMPHPGFKAINNKQYDGRHSELNDDFKNELNNLVTWLFKPKNLIPKKIFKEELTGRKLYNYMKAYFEVFQMDAPEIQPIYEATVHSQLRNLVDNFLIEFKNAIDQNLDHTSENFVENLDAKATFVKSSILKSFKDATKMGTVQDEEKFSKILGSKIDEFYANWRSVAVQNYNTYIKTLRDAEVEKERLEKELNETILANREEMKLELESIGKNMQRVEQDFERERSLAEAKRIEIINQIKNDQSLTLEEVEASVQETEKIFQLSQMKWKEERDATLNELQLRAEAMKNELSLKEQYHQKMLLQQAAEVERQIQLKAEADERNWERQQAMKLEELRFNQQMEENRIVLEQKRHEMELQMEERNRAFELEKLQIRAKNEQSMREYQLRKDELQIESEKEIRLMNAQAEERKHQLEIEMMNQKTQMQALENERTNSYMKSVMDFTMFAVSAATFAGK